MLCGYSYRSFSYSGSSCGYTGASIAIYYVVAMEAIAIAILYRSYSYTYSIEAIAIMEAIAIGSNQRWKL